MRSAARSPIAKGDVGAARVLLETGFGCLREAAFEGGGRLGAARQVVNAGAVDERIDPRFKIAELIRQREGLRGPVERALPILDAHEEVREIAVRQG